VAVIAAVVTENPEDVPNAVDTSLGAASASVTFLLSVSNQGNTAKVLGVVNTN